jgi:SAM-dependent methyltransferase
MGIYGRDFAEAYNDQWAFFGPRNWPSVRSLVSTHSPDARTWLDLCCGAGSLLKLVCADGFSATGLDLSPYQLRYARKNAPAARLARADVRDFALGQEFDVITCLFDSLNYLMTKRDLGRAFQNARRHLAAGGVFIFDMNTFEGLEDRWCTTGAIHWRQGTVIMESSFDAERAVGRCLITGFIKRGRSFHRFQEEHIQRGWRVGEIDDLLRRAGLSFRRYDSFRLARPRKRTSRIVYACWNPAR